MTNRYETLVRWYLRFNGYLSIENFLVHGAVPARVLPEGETDILAVRFPYSAEDVGFPLQNDPRLDDPEVVRNKLIDFVIAEVKGGRRTAMNRVWKPSETSADQAEQQRTVSYLVRWLGAFADEHAIERVAAALRASHRAREGQYLIRLVYFAKRSTTEAAKFNVPHITFRQLTEFLVRVRMSCYVDRRLGVRSPHDQWDPMIKEIWSIGDPEAPGDEIQKVNWILEYVDTGNRPSASHSQTD